jgi:hypothetical protein
MHQSILSAHQYVNQIGLVCQFDFPFKKAGGVSQAAGPPPPASAGRPRKTEQAPA